MKCISLFKKAKILVPFLSLFAIGFANAQTFTLSGKVVDENKKPLVGATVSIIDSKIGTTTDLDGNYQLKLPVGEYSLEAK